MARPIRFCPASFCILALAAASQAAETGMLYVESNPAGATVIVNGEARGRTPILVRRVPAGEAAVELRISGAEPVIRRVVVKPLEVVNVNIRIQVGRCVLTLVSDPPKATIFIDGVPAGKTPVTLRDLAPGRHRVVLLMAGYPKTERIVSLIAGARRMLEVDLGVEAAAEPEAAAGAAPGAKPRPPGEAPLEIQLVLAALTQAVADGHYARARRDMEALLLQPDGRKFEREVRAAVGVARTLEARRDAIQKAAADLVGKDVKLKLKKGSRSGKVESVSIDGINGVSRITVDGEFLGESRFTIAWSDLALDEEERLARAWKPKGADGEVARVLLARARKDDARAARALAAAGDHPLKSYLERPGEAKVPEAVDDTAERWRLIEKRSKRRAVTVPEEFEYTREVTAFWEAHRDTKSVQALRRRVSDVLARVRRASGLVGYWAFDEGRGSVARDSSGGGRNGAIRGASRTTGRIDGALKFDGAKDCVSLPNVKASAQMTVAAWINFSSRSGAQVIVGWGSDMGTEEFRITYGRLEYGAFRGRAGSVRRYPVSTGTTRIWSGRGWT
ncbi:MAG: PEGA domain-containing protein, partial [Planctomycetota bacterium]